MRGKGCLHLGLIVLVWLAVPGGRASARTVTVDGAQTYQVIEGFGVNANYWSWRNNELQPVLDALIDQAGMTLFRVIFNNGWETNNDNSDSNVMNWDYYNVVYGAPEAQKLWGLMGYLNQRGVTNGVMLNFQGPGPDWMMNGAQLVAGYEDEWAEMIASLVVYARNTRQLQFKLLAPNNEPDIAGEGIQIPTAAQYLTTLRDLALKLDTNGLSDVRFVGPDRSTSGTNWLPEMMTDAVVMSKLAHFGLHSYSEWGGGSDGVFDFIQQSAYPDTTFWMTEFNVWCASCEAGLGNTNDWPYCRGTAEYLLGHLANGASAGLVWEGYDSYYPHHGRWSFWGLLGVDNTNAVPRTYTPRKNFYTLAQIAKYVRPGAQQIDVSDSTSLDYLLAFYQPDSGQVTLTGINSDTNAMDLSGTLTNLPPVASLDLYYTDSTTNLYHSATVPVTNGMFAVTVPADCVFTLTGFDPAKIAVSVLITNPADGAHYSAPATIPIQATASTTTGILSSVQFYNGAAQIGQAGVPPYCITWSNIAPGAYVLTASATNSIGNSRVSPGVRVTVTGLPQQIVVTPTNALVVPYGTQLFTATATDALGNQLEPSPAFAWSVSGGGAIGDNGLFTAGGSVGGPFTITAGIGDITGTAGVSITTNLNLAPNGIGYTWYSLGASTDNTPQAPAPGINDGDLDTDVSLLSSDGEDITNAYEAAGVVWSTPQTISRVVYENGSYDTYHDGVFATEFGLQFSPDGTTWTNAAPAWIVAPAYTYNSAISANAEFGFTGGVAIVRGVRCVGRVHTSGDSMNSWVAFATELQAFAAPVSPPPVLTASANSNGISICWPAPLTNYILEAATNLIQPITWSPVSNAPQPVGDRLTITVPSAPARQFFRLHQR